MLSFDYKEIELFNEIINFKIIDENSLLNDYKITNYKLNYSINKINYLLGILKLEKIIKKNDYICHYSAINRKNFDIKKLFLINTNIRKNLIYLYLILSENKFSLYGFSKIINMEIENKKYLKKDLFSVLKSLDIDCNEYENSFRYNIVKDKIKNFRAIKEKILKDTLLECLEKTNSKTQTQIEQLKIQIIEQELKIKNLGYMYEKIFNFFEDYGKISSKSLKYDILTFIILNFKNQKINTSKRITTNNQKFKKNEEYMLLKKVLKEIGKIENQKIYSYFIMKVYKLIMKKTKSENIFKSDIQIKNAITSILKTESTKKLTTEKIYKVSENTIKYKEKEYTNKKIQTVSITNKKIETLLVFDIEYNEFLENIKIFEKFLNLFNITKIIKFDDLKNENSKGNNYKQILVFSNYDVKKVLVNETKNPMFFIELPTKLAKIQKKVYFDKKFLEIQKAFNIYNKK